MGGIILSSSSPTIGSLGDCTFWPEEDTDTWLTKLLSQISDNSGLMIILGAYYQLNCPQHFKRSQRSPRLILYSPRKIRLVMY